MKNSINLTIISAIALFLVLGCGQAANTSTMPTAPTNSATLAANSSTGSTTTAPTADKPIAIQSKVLTKDYDENELAADDKYKGKMLAVSGKVENIAETMGNVTVQLAGHAMFKNVMCSFDEAERGSVAKLKKGQNATLVGKGDGMTMGIYAGLQSCKIQ